MLREFWQIQFFIHATAHSYIQNTCHKPRLPRIETRRLIGNNDKSLRITWLKLAYETPAFENQSLDFYLELPLPPPSNLTH